MMNNRIQDINDLFTMFHDFEIVGLRLADEILTMKILLPWSQMLNIENYIMTFEFYGCKFLKCNYDVRISNDLVQSEKVRYYPTEEKVSTNPMEIEKLELDVQRHQYIQPNCFRLFCTSSFGNGIGQIEFANIELTADDYKIYDNNGKEMSLVKMKEWGTDWWEGIQKMWDEQKNE